MELFAFLVAYAASAIAAAHVSAASRALPRSASLPYFASTAFATACVVSCASFQTLVSSTVLGRATSTRVPLSSSCAHTYCDAAYSVLLHHVFLQRPVHPSPFRIRRSFVRLRRRAACRFALTHGTRKPHLSHVSVMACSALSAAVLYGDHAVRAFGIHGRCRALASIHLVIAPGSRSLYFVRPWCCGLRAISIFQLLQ